MNRLISQKLIDKIKKLFTSLLTDDNGNVEVVKDLEVDGKLKVNGQEVGGSNLYLHKYTGYDGGSFVQFQFIDNKNTDYDVTALSKAAYNSLKISYYSKGSQKNIILGSFLDSGNLYLLVNNGVSYSSSSMVIYQVNADILTSHSVISY